MAERQFGPYVLVEQVAVGGMAEIYLAKTNGIAGFEKYVALKMIHPNFSEDEQFVQMLIDEAKITVLLQHVNVAQTFDLGRVGQTYYITMEYVDGADLYKLLRKGSEADLDVPIDVAAYVAKEVATGLDYAHRKRDVSGKKLGIVHRDVSPQNVLLSYNGEVKIVDFGIAKATMRARQTAAGVIKGKYYYMSPEQAWGEPVDHRTDVFSNGILLYEMLTGQMLYLEEDLHKLLDMVRKAEIAPPSTLRKDVPPQLERIVMRALAKERDDRYQTANDFAVDLERFLHAYSPVFRAPKVSKWVKQVLSDELDEPEAPTLPPSAPGFRLSITGEQLVRERSEITDDNSVIFRLKDLKPPSPARPRNLDDETGQLGAAPARPSPAVFPAPVRPPSSTLPPLPSLAKQRDVGEATRDVQVASRVPVADSDSLTGEESIQSLSVDAIMDDDESTVISESPNFEATMDKGTLATADRAVPKLMTQATRRIPSPNLPVEAEPEATVVDRGVPLPPGGGSRPSTAPTVVGQGNSRVGNEDEEAEGSTLRRTRGSAERSAIPPVAVLSASNPAPAVSEVRGPRTSRRTPAEGIPAGPSVLAKLVGSAPQSRSIAGMPVSRSLSSSTAAGSQGGSAADAPVSVPQGFDHAPSDGTTTPYDASGLPLVPDASRGLPYGQLPQGAPPLSTASQLAALEVDEIPSQFKLGRDASLRRKRALLAVSALVVCVLVGVGLGMMVFGRSEAPPANKTLEVVSIPAGAKVSVDGRPVDGVTPLTFPGAVVGQKYLVAVELPDHRTWSTETEVSAGGSSVVKVIARLEPILATLEINSTPPNAEVYINGNPRGNTPLRLEGLDPKTTKNVELRLKGYRPERKDLDWSQATDQSLRFDLRK